MAALKHSLEDIFAALERNNWQRAKTAQELGVSTHLMVRKIQAMKTIGWKVPDSSYMTDRKAHFEAPRPQPSTRSAPMASQDPAELADPAPEIDPDALRKVLKDSPKTLSELSSALSASRGSILDALDELREAGQMIYEDDGGRWIWAKRPAPGHIRKDLPIFKSDADGWLRFGFTSDNHLCSKYERLDVLDDLYDKFHAAGIATVFNAGNYIDGEASFNLHDLHTHGLQNQVAYLAKRYPQRPGVTTFAVSGDDHEGWYAQRAGVDIGKLAESTMREAGRLDWVDIGYMESFVSIVHAGSGAESKLHVMHPGGGTAYAISYTVQKIVEGYDGGEKPAVLLAGHYHKLAYSMVRNVHTIQTGCTQDQTPFMRKKKIPAHVGGGIAEVKLSERTGAVERFRVEFFPYFVRDYYNGRWNHAGPVVLADRGAPQETRA